MEIRDETRARVRKGGEWLDTKRPGWFYSIDLAALELENCCRCVLGQLFEADARASEDENIGSNGYCYATWHLLDLEEYGYSFDLGFCDYNKKNYAELEEAWIEYIKERVNS